MRIWVAGALLAVATPTFADGQQTGHAGHHPAAPSAASTPTPFVREMDAGMGRMMEAMHAPGYTGDPDADFLAMMIPHHEGAIEMARLVLIHGKDPLTRALAEDIIASQRSEVDAMKARLAGLTQAKARPAGGESEFPSLSGTRGTAEGARPATPAAEPPPHH